MIRTIYNSDLIKFVILEQPISKRINICNKLLQIQPIKF